MKKLYFIVNPAARNGFCLEIWKKVEKELQNRNVDYQSYFTEFSGHAKEIAAQISKEVPKENKIVIAVGGDGTVHEIINGIINFPHIAFGFIPGGSGNDFSRGFCIPSKPDAALAAILKLVNYDGFLTDVGKISQIDSSENYFINNMGAGLDALISYEVNKSRAKGFLNRLSLGRLVYAYFLLKKLATYKLTTLEVRIDGQEISFVDSWFITVSNQPFYGGGMKIAPAAIMNDGLFDITVVHRLSRIKMLFVFVSVFWGKHIYFKEVKTYKGKSISIRSSAPIFVHADGEHIGCTPLEIELLEGALRVVTSMETQIDNLKGREMNEFQ
ncbi:MAG: diacylglycerol kinase family lipid kinase [Bacillota bacterium]|nr:diacylglycerol kinase family lipid kinase [Bacillota bacterium]MDP4170529.1 diacylglycerol kinase family lipid kinase [Bacillota bacterium]